MISQSVSRSGLCLTQRPGLVAMITPPPLPESVGRSLRKTVMLNGEGNNSLLSMSCVNQVSVPTIMSGLCVVIMWCNWDILFLILRKFIDNSLREVWLWLCMCGTDGVGDED